jgi:hypothetical protein
MLSAIGLTVLIVGSVAALGYRELTRLRENARGTRGRLSRIEHAREAVNSSVFPEENMLALEEALRRGDYAKAKPLAENLFFAYPSDAGAYGRFLAAMTEATERLLSGGEDIRTYNLLAWHSEQQKMQVRVIKGKMCMDLHVRARNRTAQRRQKALDLAAADLERIITAIRTNPERLVSDELRDSPFPKLRSLIQFSQATHDGSLNAAGRALTNLLLLRSLPSQNDGQVVPADRLVEIASNLMDDQAYEEVSAYMRSRLKARCDRYAAKMNDAISADSTAATEWTRKHYDDLHLVVSAAEDAEVEVSQLRALRDRARSICTRHADREFASICRSYQNGQATKAKLLQVFRETRQALAGAAFGAIWDGPLPFGEVVGGIIGGTVGYFGGSAGASYGYDTFVMSTKEAKALKLNILEQSIKQRLVEGN